MDQIDWMQVNGWAWLVWWAYWIFAAQFSRRTKSGEGWLARMQHILPLGLGFFLIFHGSSHPIICGRIDGGLVIALIGTLMTLSGQLFSFWARVHLGKYWSGIITLKEGHRLIRTGPYRYLRHPLYTGFLSAILGSAIAAGTGDALIGFAIAFASYLVKMQREELLLTKEFGEEYVKFKSESAALFPHIY